MNQYDAIHHPSHYTKYKTEVIDITRYLPFCLGNVVKYVLRAPYKGGVEDCNKALQYLEWCWGEHVIMTACNLDKFRDNLHKLEDELRAENSQIANAQAAVLVYVYNFVFCFPGYIDDLRVAIFKLRRLLEEKNDE